MCTITPRVTESQSLDIRHLDIFNLNKSVTDVCSRWFVYYSVCHERAVFRIFFNIESTAIKEDNCNDCFRDNYSDFYTYPKSINYNRTVHLWPLKLDIINHVWKWTYICLWGEGVIRKGTRRIASLYGTFGLPKIIIILLKSTEWNGNTPSILTIYRPSDNVCIARNVKFRFVYANSEFRM